jgi:hypothetical protein
LQLLHHVGLMTARVLTAMDLPEGTTQAISYTLSPETYFGSSSTAGPTAGWPPRLAAWQQQLQWVVGAVGSGFRGFVEGFWVRWGAECVMLLLLAAALVGCNAVSLLLLLLVVLGMAVAAPPSVDSAGGASRGVAASGGGSSNGVDRGAGSGRYAGDRSGRRTCINWWWWHLVLGVLVIVLVSPLNKQTPRFTSEIQHCQQRRSLQTPIGTFITPQYSSQCVQVVIVGHTPSI